MAIQRVGWRPYVSPALSASTLLTSIYGVWNAETTTTTLATGAYGAWNAEGTVTTAQLATGAHGAWNGEKSGASLDANILRVYAGDDLNDTSGNAQNATNVGGVTFAAGKFGNAFTFNGSNNISLPDNSLNSLTGDFTVSMWVKVQNTGTLQTLFSSIGSDGTNYYGFTINNYGGIYTTIYTGSGSTGISLNETSPNPYNTWYHVVVTRKAGTRTRIYYNGVNTQTNADARNVTYYNGVNKVNIGAFYTSSYRVANGTQIDAVTVWNKELNPSEVLSLYNFGNGAQYPYSTLTLPSSDDTIGSNLGTLMNGGVLTTAGKIGNAFTFDGVNDYISLPDNSLNFTGDFSISLWYYTNVVGVEKSIISNYNSNTTGGNPNGTGFIIATSTSNQIGIAIYNAGYTTLYSPSNTITANTWYHVVITRKSGTRTRVYVNGSLSQSDTSAKNPIFPQATYLSSIGQQPGAGGYVNGKMDAVSTWSKELTAEEISALYNGGSGNQYPFTPVTVGTTADSVSTNNGTIVGGVTYTTGIVGNSFQFNGTTGYVSLPDNSLNLTGDFTISVWVYPTAGTPQTIINNLAYTNGTIYKGWQLEINNISGAQAYKVTFSIGQGPSNTAYTGWEYSTTALTPNAWNHILIKRVSGVNTYCWVNNISQSYTLYGTGKDITLNPTYHTTQYNTIGAAKILSGAVSNYLANGSKVDGLTIWNKALTDDELIQLYNMGGGIQYPFTTQTIKTPYAAYNGDSLVDPIGARNAAIVGGVTYTAGKVGNAYTFNGSTGYLTLPANSMRFAGSLSISMWVYPTVYPTTAQGQIGLISNTSGGYKEGFDISLYNPTGNVSTYIQFGNGTAVNGGYAMAMTPSALPLNTWTLLTVTFEAGVGLKAYYNGVLQASVSSSATTLTYANMPATYTPTIGYGSNATGPNYGVKFAGQIDGLTFWNSALTAPEVITLFNDGAGMEYPYSSTLPAKLPSASDSYGTNNGTLMNGCTFTTGKIGKAFTFDGVNDYVNFSNDFFKPVSNFSANFWINTNNATTAQTIFTSVATNGFLGWRLFISGGVVTFRTFPINTTFNELSTSASKYTASNWHMITVINDISNGMNIYVNGTLAASNTIKQAISWGSTTINKLGQNWDNGTVFNGKIDAMTLWAKALTSTEVTDLYNSGNGKQYPSY